VLFYFAGHGATDERGHFIKSLGTKLVLVQ